MESYQHNQVKLAVACALQAKAQREKRGLYFTDGMMLYLPGSERTYMPDGFFVSYRQLQAFGRFKRNAKRGVVYGFLGLPSIIVEVASPSRLQEDYHDKLREYEKAGVREFWLFRPAGPTYSFDLLTLDRRHPNRRYYRQRPEGEGGYSKALRMYARLGMYPTNLPGLPSYILHLTESRRPVSMRVNSAA